MSSNSEQSDERLIKEEPCASDCDASDVDYNHLMHEEEEHDGDDDDRKELDEPFCFESDHVALKNNKDYQYLLRSILVLESQRTAAVKDLDTLLDLKEEALKHPIEFVDKLQRRVEMGIPRPQTVASLPLIDWDRYATDVDLALSGAGSRGNAPLTRHKLKSALLFGIKDEPQFNIKDDPDSVPVSEVPFDQLPGTTAIKQENLSELAMSKSLTFNQRWTHEEQRQFERLVRKYPPERNQTKRNEKIARELGTRTAVQVATHMQKYLIKLAERKLPVPGPMPNASVLRRKTSRGRSRNRYNDLFYPSSTFLASYELPVYMSENDSDDDALGKRSFDPTSSAAGSHCATPMTSSSDDDDDDFPLHIRQCPEYRELRMLRNMKRKREKAANATISTQSVNCCICRDRLVGLAWKCMDCVSPVITLCSKCSKLSTDNHTSSHLLERTNVSPSSLDCADIDKDYSYSTADSFSYLDPNYQLD